MFSSPKLSAFIATSLDGFIARPDGNIDWLTQPDEQIEGEDYGYQTFMDSVDVLVMGRNTFEKVLTFGEWPYADKPVVVLSTSKLDIPTELTPHVEVLSLPPMRVVHQLNKRNVKHVYLDGGQTIQGFLRSGLINELTITRIPVLLGQGISLFGSLDHDIRLKHIRTTTFSNGFVQSVYTL